MTIAERRSIDDAAKVGHQGEPQLLLSCWDFDERAGGLFLTVWPFGDGFEIHIDLAAAFAAWIEDLEKEISEEDGEDLRVAHDALASFLSRLAAHVTKMEKADEA